MAELHGEQEDGDEQEAGNWFAVTPDNDAGARARQIEAAESAAAAGRSLPCRQSWTLPCGQTVVQAPTVLSPLMRSHGMKVEPSTLRPDDSGSQLRPAAG